MRCATVARTMPRLSSAAGGAALAACGTALAAVHAVHATQMPFVAGLFEAWAPLVVAVGVAGYGVWLAWSGADRVKVRAVLRGAAIGVAVMLVVFVWTEGHRILTGAEIEHLPFVVANVLTAGIAVGVVLGSYDARSQRERRRAEALFANLPNPALYVERTPKGRRVEEVNEAFCTTFGTTESSVGGPLDDCLPQPAPESQPLSAVLTNDSWTRFRCAAAGGPGVREFVVTAAPGGQPGHEFVLLVDITDEGRRERRLSVLNRVLRHDVRSAVNVIVGHAEQLAPPDDPHREVIETRSEVLVDLSRRARDLDRLLSGETPSSVVDLRDLVERHVDTFAADAPSVSVDCDLPDDPVLFRDNGLVGTAVDELFANVREHAGPSPSVTVSVTVDGDAARLSIADDGPGIPESERAVLSREEETELDHASGVGLWFVTWVVSDLGGDVDVAVDDGTTVTLVLPLAADAAADDADGPLAASAGRRGYPERVPLDSAGGADSGVIDADGGGDVEDADGSDVEDDVVSGGNVDEGRDGDVDGDDASAGADGDAGGDAESR